MRLHTESTIRLLDDACTVMGTHLRHFKNVVCEHYLTQETEREYNTRIRAQARNASGSSSISSGWKKRMFNNAVIKSHFLGYYAAYIRLFGSAEAFSSVHVRISGVAVQFTCSFCALQGEHTHIIAKRRYGRTNTRQAEGQMAKIDVRETRLRRMGEELAACEIDVPGRKTKTSNHRSSIIGPEVHHWIAQESDRRIALYLSELDIEHSTDPAFEVSPPVLFYLNDGY